MTLQDAGAWAQIIGTTCAVPTFVAAWVAGYVWLQRWRRRRRLRNPTAAERAAAEKVRRQSDEEQGDG